MSTLDFMGVGGQGGWVGVGGWSRHTARSCDHHRWWNVTIFSACVEATVCWLLFQTRCWRGTTTTSQWISLLWGLRRSWTWTQATSWKPGECVKDFVNTHQSGVHTTLVDCDTADAMQNASISFIHTWHQAKCFRLIYTQVAPGKMLPSHLYTRGTRQSASVSFIHTWHQAKCFRLIYTQVAPGKMLPSHLYTRGTRQSASVSFIHTWHQAKCFRLIYTHVAPGKMLPSHLYTRGTRQNAAISFMHMWGFTLSSTLIFI